MPSNSPTPILYVSTGKLNTVNDQYPGSSVGDISGVGAAPGQLGQEICLDAEGLFGNVKAYDASIGVLYPGRYKYVKTREASVRGHIAFWVDPTSTSAPYYVTTTPQNGNQAGVFLNVISAGNHGFIQTEGIASVLFAASLTTSSPLTKDFVVVTSGADTVDDLAASTTLTNTIYKLRFGIAEGAPASGSISLVKMFSLGTNY